MNIKWQMTINDSAHKKLSKALAIAAMENAMKETLRELRDTYAKAPTPKITGNLRRSNTYDVKIQGKGIVGQVKNSAPYWFYVNFGTSRMKKEPSHFLEKGIDKVQPTKKIVERFKKNMEMK